MLKQRSFWFWNFKKSETMWDIILVRSIRNTWTSGVYSTLKDTWHMVLDNYWPAVPGRLSAWFLWRGRGNSRRGLRPRSPRTAPSLSRCWSCARSRARSCPRTWWLVWAAPRADVGSHRSHSGSESPDLRHEENLSTLPVVEILVAYLRWHSNFSCTAPDNAFVTPDWF